MTTIKINRKFTPHYYEQKAWQNNKIACGIDEVGRACLAGPVVTAAAIIKPINLKSQENISGYYKLLKDSKKLTPNQRLKVYNWLINNCEFSVSVIHHRTIDRINIYQATLKSMKRSYMQLSAKINKSIDLVLVDAMPLNIESNNTNNINVLYFNKGEDLSMSIAAASIIAKVKRDSIMQRLDNVFPQYFFFNHKGYFTSKHKKALIDLGRTIIHRSSFLPGQF